MQVRISCLTDMCDEIHTIYQWNLMLKWHNKMCVQCRLPWIHKRKEIFFRLLSQWPSPLENVKTPLSLSTLQKKGGKPDLACGPQFANPWSRTLYILSILHTKPIETEVLCLFLPILFPLSSLFSPPPPSYSDLPVYHFSSSFTNVNYDPQKRIRIICHSQVYSASQGALIEWETQSLWWPRWPDQ